MNSNPRPPLEELRERLASTPSYPWEGVKVWVARAQPFFRNRMPAQLKDFEAHTKEPDWASGVYIASGGGIFGDPEENNFAETDADVSRQNRAIAESAKQNALSWMDGLIQYLPTDTSPAQTAEERVVSLLDRMPSAI